MLLCPFNRRTEAGYPHRADDCRKLILQQNTRPHTANKTLETIRDLKFELKHSLYSSDFAPRDFHMLGPLKNAIRGLNFFEREEVKMRCIRVCARNTKHFSPPESQIVERWTMCIEMGEDYVEK